MDVTSDDSDAKLSNYLTLYKTFFLPILNRLNITELWALELIIFKIICLYNCVWVLQFLFSNMSGL